MSSGCVGSGGTGDPNWEDNLRSILRARILQSKSNKERISKRVYVVATDGTATKDTFLDLWQNTDPNDVQFIADEVHNLGTTGGQKLFKLPCERRIGLSATYVRQWDPVGTQALESFFGGVVFTYTIADGIRDGYLCHYQVHHTFVELTDPEWSNYHDLTRTIGRYFKMKEQALKKKEFDRAEQYGHKQTELKQERADIIKAAANKTPGFEGIIKNLPHDQKTIVFCTDTPQLEDCSTVLDNNSKRYRKYSTVGGFSQQQLQGALDSFESGDAQFLVGIGCLDEGLDVKSCTTCVLISSSGTRRQYVQRRGRMLRQLADNAGIGKVAHLYDLIALPPSIINGHAWTADELTDYDKTINALFRHELTRSDIICEAADNKTEIERDLTRKFAQFGKTLTQIRGNNRP